MSLLRGKVVKRHGGVVERRQRHDIVQHSASGAGIHLRVNQGVLDRMFQILNGTAVEDCGKLLGNIIRSGGGAPDTLEVVSFLDSGPRVTHSRSHLMPDGEYQERLFRLVESLDPAIEHIGSWHSHHCNGHPTLSGGDIEGYLESINDPNYRPAYFVAILVVGLKRTSVVPKFFVFSSERGGPFEIPPSMVEVMAVPYVGEPVLLAAQCTALQLRRTGTRAEVQRQHRSCAPAPADGLGAP